MWKYRLVGEKVDPAGDETCEDILCDLKGATSPRKDEMVLYSSDEESQTPSTSNSSSLPPFLNPEAAPYQPLHWTHPSHDPAASGGYLPVSVKAQKFEDLSQTESRSVVSVNPSQTSSSGPANAIFWSSDHRTLRNKGHSWKSDSTKLANEYARLRKLVTFIAPEQFQNPARPSRGPCDIVPTCLQEFVQHKREIVQMINEQMGKNILWMEEQIKQRKAHFKIKSCLGKEGRIYEAGLSPVLALPTIWSAEFKNLDLPTASWPTLTELQYDGDHREQLKTKCRRFFPAPRMPRSKDVLSHKQTFLQALPLDQTGPIYVQGPAPLEVIENNSIMNNDEQFEEQGSMYLGMELMNEVGHWSAPFVPEWLLKKRLSDIG